MRLSSKDVRAAALIAACLAAADPPRALADDPQPGSRLARLFRFGQNGPASGNAPAHDHSHDVPSTAAPTRPPVRPGEIPNGGIYPTATAPPATPSSTTGGPSQRIAPVPRVTRPATDADPILTRVAVCRAEGAGNFGTFLQVFADGTVIDSQGVHRLGPDAMKPLREALQQGDLYRQRGHCGAPSTDFVEQAHVVLYERTLGKLRATAFSYSGNPQGCDASVFKLHKAIEAVEMKLSAASSPSPTPAATIPASAPALAPPAGGTPVLGLTPIGPNP